RDVRWLSAHTIGDADLTIVSAAPAESNTATRTVEVLAISPTDWRVSDPTLPESDGSSVIGVVQVVGDTFEVTRIGTPFSRYYFGTLDLAVSFLASADAIRPSRATVP